MGEVRDAAGLTEEEFLKQYDPDKYPKPSLTADVVIFRVFPKDGGTGSGKGQDAEKEPEVLLIRRGGHPYLGCYAFPGGFSNRDEAMEETAKRELQEETGITGIDPKLVGIYSKPGRDPRGWTISAAYMAVFNADEVEAEAGDDAAAVAWVGLSKALEMKLAFDHSEILRDAIAVFRAN